MKENADLISSRYRDRLRHCPWIMNHRYFGGRQNPRLEFWIIEFADDITRNPRSFFYHRLGLDEIYSYHETSPDPPRITLDATLSGQARIRVDLDVNENEAGLCLETEYIVLLPSYSWLGQKTSSTVLSNAHRLD